MLKVNRIRTYETEGVTVVELHGRLNLDSRGLDEFRGEIRRLLRSGVRRFVLDLKHVKSIDSTGIGEIVAARNSITEWGGEFSLVNASSRIQGVLSIIELTNVLDGF